MVDFLLGVPGKLKTLLDRLTATRAANLDDLDTTVSSRAPSSTAVSNVLLTSTRIANLDDLDAPVSAIPTAIVKSMQTGHLNGITLTDGAAGSTRKYTAVSISSVDKDKCILKFEGSGGTSSTNGLYSSPTSVVVAMGTYVDESGPSLVIHSSDVNATHLTGSWTIVEFY